MAIDVSELPLKYQQQAYAKYMAQQGGGTPRQAKYHNTPTQRITGSGGTLHFDSRKEARRYDELAALLRAGEIRDLRLQVEFTLQGAYTTPAGERIRAIRYLADFTYTTPAGEYIVEDVKSRGTRTAKYAMKKKLMADRLGIQIREV